MRASSFVELYQGLAKAARGRTFVIVALLALSLKMWLTSEIRMIPIYGPHDMSNFIEHARSLSAGLWFGSYDDLTLIKRPFFPIYLTILHELGIPLPIGHTLFYALACLTACAAIRPLVRSQRALSLIFVVLLFNPFTYNIDAWIVNRSQVNAGLALMVVACSAAIFLRRSSVGFENVGWALGLGASLGAFWLTREEAVWITPCLLVFLGAYAIYALRQRRSSWLLRSLPILLPAGIWALSIAAIMAMNGRHYGWYTVDEQDAPELVSAYNSLARINVAPVQYVPVPRAAREIAYSVSPAARELQSGFEGAQTGWISQSCHTRNICTDYGGGFFIWAFRDAVSHAGHYSSGSDARAFYLKLAAEIDGACDSKRIACLPKAFTTLPPMHAADVPILADNFMMGARLLVSFFSPATIPIEVTTYGDPPSNILYDYSVIVASVAETSEQKYFNGWILHKTKKRLAFVGSDAQTVAIDFSASPDVYKVFSRAGKQYANMNAGRARFHISLPCSPTCYLTATAQDNSVTRVALDHDFQNADLYLHLDNSSGQTPYNAGDDHLKIQILTFVARAYQVIVPWSVLIAIGLITFRFASRIGRFAHSIPDYTIVATVIAATCCALIMILALISTFTYACFISEYMSPMFPLLLFATSLAAAVEMTGLYRALWARDFIRGRFNRVSSGHAPRVGTPD